MARAGQIVRPAVFDINHFAPLGRGALLLGLGCGPGAGQFTDSSLARNHGTLTNMVPAEDWVDAQGLGRKALEFDSGLSQYIPFDWFPVYPFTVACWFNTTSADAVQTLWSRQIGTSSSNMDRMILYQTAVQLQSTIAASSQFAKATTNYTSGVWGHATCVLSSPTLRAVYFNGGSYGQNTTSRDLTPDKSTIGKVFHVAPEHHDGKLADLCIWNRALSPSEIWAISRPWNSLLEVGGQPLIWTPSFRTYFYGALGGGEPPVGNRRRRLLICGAA